MVADTDLHHERQRLSSRGGVRTVVGIGETFEETRFPPAEVANVIP
jgi:hypothetical protein